MIRTRFAPSPTGLLHVGAVRTALFAWLYSRQNDGEFILRIEDTDKKREHEGAIEHIQESLRWLGIEWQEGPDIGGPYGPYVQSERLDIYHDYARQLIDKGLAYADPYTAAELDELRAKAKRENRAFLFREHRPEQPPVWENGKFPLRFRVPKIENTEWEDAARGQLHAGAEALDDFIIIKADGFPTYNFAHVVDDELMHISHVMRGEEFIASTPKFIALIDALGFKRPVFVTLPPVLGLSGGKKLSKRDGARDVLAYRDEGYLPQAVVNFLASLGWNDGTDQEIFSVDDLLRRFDLSRLQKSGARFNPDKLKWLNWQHFRQLEPRQQLDHVRSNCGPETAALLDSLVADPERASELACSKADDLESYLAQLTIFTSGWSWTLDGFDLEQIDKNLNADRARKLLEAARAGLKNLETFDEASIERVLRDIMAEQDAKPREFLNLVRWAVSGQRISPGLFEIIATLGREATLARLTAAADA